MEKFIGVKILQAKPMSLGEYNKYRCWQMPDNEDPQAEGHLVEYEDTNANHPNHEGYVSWSPKKAFDEAYRRIDAMTFGLAIEAMKKGKKVARAGWNGKGMFVYLVAGGNCLKEDLINAARKHVSPVTLDGASVDICPHIDMMAADGSIVIGWLASQTDMLAEDWMIVEGETTNTC